MRLSSPSCTTYVLSNSSVLDNSDLQKLNKTSTAEENEIYSFSRSFEFWTITIHHTPEQTVSTLNRL